MSELYSIDHKEVSNAVVRRIKAVKDIIKEIEASTNVKVVFNDSVKDIIVTKTIGNIIDELHIVFQYTGDSEYPDINTLRAKLRNMFEYEDPHYDILRDEIKKMYNDRLISENNWLDARACLVRQALNKLNKEEDV